MSGQGATIVRVLRSPALRRVQLAFFGSTLGDWAYGVAVMVWAYDAGGAAAVGGYQALRFVVAAVAGPLGAHVADRVRSRKRYLMANDAARAVLVATAAVVVGLGGPAALVLGLALVAAGVGASFRAAQSGLVPRLVDDPADLTATNAVTSNLETAAMFSGPAIGALLLAFVDVQAVFWLNVVTFVWSLSLVAAVRVASEPEPERGDDEAHEGFLREVTAGFAQLRRDRDLGTVSLLAASQGVIWGALSVFLVVLAVQVLDAGAAGVGYLNTLMGIGTVAGGLTVLALVGKGRLGRDMAYGVLGWALPLVAMAAFPSPVVAIAALAVIGLADPWVNLGLDTIPQRVAPQRIISRVFAAVESSLIAAMALGAAAAPLLVHVLGLRGSMAVLGVVVTAVAVASLPRMSRLDARLTAAEDTELVALGRDDSLAAVSGTSASTRAADAVIADRLAV